MKSDIEQIKARLPTARTYVKDYFAYWYNGRCYFYRRSADNDWVYEDKRDSTKDTNRLLVTKLPK